MMSRKQLLSGAAAFSLAAGGTLAVTVATPAPAAPPSAFSDADGWPAASERKPSTVVKAARERATRHGGKVLAVVEEITGEAFIDVGEPGDSAGDYFVQEGDLYTRKGRLVGRDSVKCTFAITTFQCDATAWINGKGKIVVAGAFFGEDVAEPIAITGGTGRFREVAGQLSVIEGADETTVLVFHLAD